MSLVKYGGGIVQMSGSIAGTTHARNRFGNYCRARTKPVNPRSSRQSAVRSLVMMLAEQWRESPMTDNIRLAWQVYANSVNWTNALGESVTLTGFNMFIRSNIARITAGLDLVTAAPVDLGLPSGDETLVFTAFESTQKINITFDDTADWCTEDDAAMSIEMGCPQSPSHGFFNGPWRFSDVLLGVAPGGIASPQAIDPAWALVGGQKIWVRAKVIRADARCSTPFTAAPVTINATGTVLHAAGTLVPNSVGDYPLFGQLAGQPCYRRADAAFFIWYNSDDSKSYISILQGAKGTLWWEKAGNPVAGSYTHGGTATGDATVTSN